MWEIGEKGPFLYLAGYLSLLLKLSPLFRHEILLLSTPLFPGDRVTFAEQPSYTMY